MLGAQVPTHEEVWSTNKKIQLQVTMLVTVAS